ncbi:hypothetical protein BDW68DRAFT_94232 [Aspergillus falconensis]
MRRQSLSTQSPVNNRRIKWKLTPRSIDFKTQPGVFSIKLIRLLRWDGEFQAALWLAMCCYAFKSWPLRPIQCLSIRRLNGISLVNLSRTAWILGQARTKKIACVRLGRTCPPIAHGPLNQQ